MVVLRAQGGAVLIWVVKQRVPMGRFREDVSVGIVRRGYSDREKREG